MALMMAVSVLPTYMYKHGHARGHAHRLRHVQGLFAIVAAAGLDAAGEVPSVEMMVGVKGSVCFTFL